MFLLDKNYYYVRFFFTCAHIQIFLTFYFSFIYLAFLIIGSHIAFNSILGLLSKNSLWNGQQDTWRNGYRPWFLKLSRRQSSGGCRFNPHYMANGIRTGHPRGFNKGRCLKFHEGSRVLQTPEEGRRTYRPKRCGNNNKDEDNRPKTLNDKKEHTWFFSFPLAKPVGRKTLNSSPPYSS